MSRQIAADWPGPAAEGPLPLAVLASPNGPNFLAMLLACRQLGLGAILADSATRHNERHRIASALGAGWLLEAEDGWLPGPAWRTTDSARPAPAGADFVKLTSGSTGEPRGVLTSEEQLLTDEAQLASTMELVPGDVFLATVPLSHSYGLASVALPPLLRDGSLLLPDASDPLGTLRALRDGSATVAPTVPAVLSGLVQRRGELSPSLRRVISAGAPLPPPTARAFLERFGQPVHVFYGASECGGITYDRPGQSGLDGTLGTRVDGVELTLEGDPDAARVVVRSPAVATGYHPDESQDLSSGRFLTADLGALDGDELRLVGRVDDIINVKGKKVHPTTVESILREAPEVADVVVVAHEDGPETSLRAVVESSGPETFDRAALLRYCREHLAEHKVPRSLLVVRRLPRNERGKIDRQALVQLARREDS
ncbi:MAG: fatty acid--CoA ligase family protein [Acidobacteriota bacterium]